MAPAAQQTRPVVRLQRLLLRNAKQLAVFCLAMAYCGPYAASQLARSVRVDENGLLAGHAASSFGEDSQQVAWEAKQKLEVGTDVQALEMARDAIRALRFDVMVHRPRSEELDKCTCLAAVTRAPGGDGKECVVLVSPVGGKNEEERENNAMAFGTAAGVMHHLRTQAWLAKDVLWVVPDAGCSAQRALRTWMEAYYAPGVHPKEGEPEEESRVPRTGQITAALVLRGSKDAELKVDALGPNGALPNLDLVAAVQFLAGRYGLLHSWPVATSPTRHLLSFMWKQAIGAPTGLHGEFGRFYIDAATIEGGGTKQSTYAAVVVLTIRSLSNIGEKFHHSTFLYAFTAPDMMVTIRDYVVLVVLVLMALVFQASHLLEELGENTALKTGGEEKLTPSDAAHSDNLTDRGNAQEEEVLQGGLCVRLGLATARRRVKEKNSMARLGDAESSKNGCMDWRLPVVSAIALHAWGLVLGGLLLLAVHVGATPVMSLLLMICYWVGSLHFVVIPLAKVNIKLRSVRTLQAVSYFSTAAWFAGLAALNWALMYFCGLLFFPICICASQLKISNKLQKTLLLLLWALTSPIVVFAVLGSVSGIPLHTLLYDWAAMFLRYGVLSYVAGFGVFLPLFIVNGVVLFEN
mmetsp:Transcript_11304/g.69794  ORF Transcript_11304/g.69794 Transcript_11304/m.69794 type:complete len:634 (+) Transcript_11304:1620-3521(+)